MDRILKAIKCIECENILETPIILPCNHSLCRKHLSKKNIGDKLRCAKCGINHEIPTNGFPINEALFEIIEAQISLIDFGSDHKEAVESLNRLTQAKQDVENLLNNPFSYACEEINQLKKQVRFKSEQLKLKIDEEAQKLLTKLNDCQSRCENSLTTDSYLTWKREFESNMEIFSSRISRCKSKLNELKCDKIKWKKITEECNKAIEELEEGKKAIRNDMMFKDFKKYSKYVDFFQQISIDDLFTPRNGSSNRTSNGNASVQNSPKPNDMMKVGLSSLSSAGAYLNHDFFNKSTSPRLGTNGSFLYSIYKAKIEGPQNI